MKNINESFTYYFSLIYQRKDVLKRKHCSNLCVKEWQISSTFSNLTKNWKPSNQWVESWNSIFCKSDLGRLSFWIGMATQWFPNTAATSQIHKNWFSKINGRHTINEGDSLRQTPTF